MPTKYFKNKKIIIIGAGFSGLSSACFLAKMDYEVNVLEKHSSPGGRARNHSAKGYIRGIWDRLGIGCLMFLNVFLKYLAKNHLIFINLKD